MEAKEKRIVLEEDYNKFISALESAEILNRKHHKDENGKESEQWDISSGLIVIK